MRNGVMSLKSFIKFFTKHILKEEDIDTEEFSVGQLVHVNGHQDAESILIVNKRYSPEGGNEYLVLFDGNKHGWLSESILKTWRTKGE
jgi:hypothetical protein